MGFLRPPSVWILTAFVVVVIGGVLFLAYREHIGKSLDDPGLEGPWWNGLGVILGLIDVGCETISCLACLGCFTLPAIAVFSVGMARWLTLR